MHSFVTSQFFAAKISMKFGVSGKPDGRWKALTLTDADVCEPCLLLSAASSSVTGTRTGAVSSSGTEMSSSAGGSPYRERLTTNVQAAAQRPSAVLQLPEGEQHHFLCVAALSSCMVSTRDPTLVWSPRTSDRARQRAADRRRYLLPSGKRRRVQLFIPFRVTPVEQILQGTKFTGGTTYSLVGIVFMLSLSTRRTATRRSMHSVAKAKTTITNAQARISQSAQDWLRRKKSPSLISELLRTYRPYRSNDLSRTLTLTRPTSG